MSNEARMIRKAETLLDAAAMRNIRNECRMFMTKNNAEISEEEQQKWWRVIKNAPTVRPLVVEIEGSIVGYGLVNFDLETKQAWLTGALTESFRGRGLGQKLFEHMVAMVVQESCTPWLEVRADNYPAYAMYSSIGFRTMERTRDIITMAWYEGSDA